MKGHTSGLFVTRCSDPVKRPEYGHDVGGIMPELRFVSEKVEQRQIYRDFVII
jgi:hypothetical protein